MTDQDGKDRTPWIKPVSFQARPCPFCGGTDIMISDFSPHDPPYVFCDTCGAKAPSRNPELVRKLAGGGGIVATDSWLRNEAWNIRAE